MTDCGGAARLKNFACISGVSSYSLTFIAARELYFRDESHLSFLYILYSLEKLPRRAYLQPPFRPAPFSKHRL
jgi:hypothetical protein